MNLSFWAAAPQVQEQLNQLQRYLLKTVDLPDQPIHIKILKLLQSGGKFLRPGIFYLFAELGPNHDQDQLLAGASAQELLHLALKFHDQISDDKLKIPNPGHNQQRNAIYAGDYLFTRYFEEILKTAPSSSEFSDHLKAMQRILTGHLDQLQHRFDFTETVADYFAEINQRTGKAFQFSAEQGAKIADATPELVTLSAELGTTIGDAYQVSQDIQLAFNDQQNLLANLQNGQYPLPVILSMNQSEIQQLLEKRHHLTLQDIGFIQTQFDRSAVDAQYQQLTAHLDDLLKQLPAGKAQTDLRKVVGRLL